MTTAAKNVNIIDNNKKNQIEKTKRRKNYDDQQVQGTNNSSIVSKRSVEKHYTNLLQPQHGEFFKYFVKQKKFRRSPAINRGYWIRMETIRTMIMRIISFNSGAKINIINLGCGFDSLPFQMLHSNKVSNLNFIDIDYPDLIVNKYNLIMESEEIKDLIGEFTSESSNYKLKSNQYQLVGCDLKDINGYKEIIESLVDQPDINIFVAEVSLAYMNPKFANSVIEVSSSIPNSHFLILEQIIPDGKNNSFAQKMLYHFDHLRSPIQCVQQYHNKNLQIERFKQYYPYVEIRNLFENWQCLIDDEMKVKINKVEEFDEWEEFILFCQHYIVVHSTNLSNQMVYTNENDEIEEKFEWDDKVRFNHVNEFNKEMLEIKFPAVSSINDQIVINGGLKQMRTNETLSVSIESKDIDVLQFQGPDIPIGRMCHSLTNINDDQLILIGGRLKPNEYLKDVYSLRDNVWTRLKVLPFERSRHSVITIDNDKLLIFGGLKKENNESPFIIYNIATETTTNLKVQGDNPGNLLSSTLVYENGTGYIFGGIQDHNIPIINSSLYKFKIKNDKIYIEKVFEHYLLSRIGSQGRIIHGGSKVLIVGGTSSTQIFTKYTSIMTLGLNTFEFKSVEIDESIREEHSPIFIGFSLVDLNNKLYVIGGGAVCYSFGSCYNSVYEIDSN
ncbi:unnamed protein product [Candida verbasci]|uniref:tRNA wybutosine-synthesizing protein 4 n=1 Tax=Candida verbasci TaxID=1227364 RepID=A0A9W4XGB5_9ASCO|nr:unnamed protein product [Candida verbasci]